MYNQLSIFSDDTLEKYFHNSGFLRELMLSSGLRTINILNYFKWTGIVPGNLKVKTIKLDFGGNLLLYDMNGKLITGDKASTAYEDAYDAVVRILRNKKYIPSKIRRNILVKINR